MLLDLLRVAVQATRQDVTHKFMPICLGPGGCSNYSNCSITDTFEAKLLGAHKATTFLYV